MTERQFSEVERVLLAIGDAAARSRRAAVAVASDRAEQHVVDALHLAHESLSRVYSDLAQRTYYAVLKVTDAETPTKSLQSAG